MSKDEVVAQLNELIFSGDTYTIDDLMDVIGDGDPFEYL
jgi:hypothetical protein